MWRNTPSPPPFATSILKKEKSPEKTKKQRGKGWGWFTGARAEVKWGSDPLEPQCGRITLHHGAREAAKLVRFGILSKVHSNFQMKERIALFEPRGAWKTLLNSTLCGGSPFVSHLRCDTVSVLSTPTDFLRRRGEFLSLHEQYPNWIFCSASLIKYTQ